MKRDTTQGQKRLLVDVNPRYFRSTEVELLWGDPSKVEKELGWTRKVDFKDLVHMMVEADLKEIAGLELHAYLEATRIK